MFLMYVTKKYAVRFQRQFLLAFLNLILTNFYITLVLNTVGILLISQEFKRSRVLVAKENIKKLSRISLRVVFEYVITAYR